MPPLCHSNSTSSVQSTANTTAARGARGIFKGISAAQLQAIAQQSLSTSSSSINTVTSAAITADNDSAWPTFDPVLTALLSTASDEEQHVFSTVAADSGSVDFTDDITAAWHSSSISGGDAADMTTGYDGIDVDTVVPLSKHTKHEDCCTHSDSLKLAASSTQLHLPVVAVVGGARTSPEKATSSSAHDRVLFAGQQNRVQQTAPPVATSARSVDATASTSSCITNTSSANGAASAATDSYYGAITVTSTVSASSSTTDTMASDCGMLQVDDVPSDDSVTRSLTQLLLSTEAGHYTERFRARQAAVMVNDWNASRYDDVAVKLALLCYWRKCGHIDEGVRSEQAKHAWDSYVHYKLA
jgi:hypothetical protein